MMIKDLSVTEELDHKALAAVRGGIAVGEQYKGDMYKYGWPSYDYKSELNFDASQFIGQSQNVVNNNGNNVAFASGITSTVTPTQNAQNNIHFF